MTDDQRPETDDQTASWRNAIKAASQPLESLPIPERTAAVIAVYTRYKDQFLSDNNRIWVTAATMIPLSLGAFVALAALADPTLAQILVFAVSGWLLMTIWFIIAENHRAFQDKSKRWMDEIERTWGFKATPDKVRQKERIRGYLTRRDMVRTTRLWLWQLVTVGTVVVILFWPGGIAGELWEAIR